MWNFCTPFTVAFRNALLVAVGLTLRTNRNLIGDFKVLALASSHIVLDLLPDQLNCKKEKSCKQASFTESLQFFCTLKTWYNFLIQPILLQKYVLITLMSYLCQLVKLWLFNKPCFFWRTATLKNLIISKTTFFAQLVELVSTFTHVDRTQKCSNSTSRAKNFV